MPVSGERYWLPHPEQAFVEALFNNSSGGKSQFSDRDGNVYEFPDAEANNMPQAAEEHHEGVTNVCNLQNVTQAAVLNTIKVRFQRQPVPEVYTAVSQILIAVNPFQALPIYGQAAMQNYLTASSVGDLPPHVFSVGAYAMKGLNTGDCKNQVVLISGESGAGKTESTKLVLSYVAEALGANVAEGGNTVQERIMQSNPVLESFGNAMTVRNNNSSRFGKFINMRIGRSGKTHIAGCEISDYLLEQTRVTKQGTGERNYHVFFQLLYSKDALKGKIEPIYEPSHYEYIKESKYKAPGIDDVLEYEAHIDALRIFGFSEEVILEVFKTVLAVLTLGNVEFGEEGDGCKIKNDQCLTDVSSLLGVAPDTVRKLLCKRMIVVVKEKTEANRSPAEANSSRNSVARLIYSRLFKYLVKSLNASLANNSNPDGQFFGVLDIAGFESFEQNSVEQLFINLSNEHLQAHFNNQIFKMELEDYAAEGIDLGAGLTYQDNSDIIQLIDSKTSILAVLDEEVSVPKASDVTFISKIVKNFEKHTRFHKPKFTGTPTFGVSHFAGLVTYDSTGWLMKNIDKPPEEIVDMFASSKWQLLRDLSEIMKEENDGVGSKKSVKKTVAAGFRASLASLIVKINQAEPHFIRCIKPNSEKVPSVLTPTMVMNQLNFSGVFEAVRIRQSGYAVRVPFEDFVKTYANMLPRDQAKKVKAMKPDEGVKFILNQMEDLLQCVGQFYPEDIITGKSKVFARSRVVILMDKARDIASVSFVIMLQAWIRGWLVRKNMAATRVAHKELNAWLADNPFYEKLGFENSALYKWKNKPAIDEQVNKITPILEKLGTVLIPITEQRRKKIDKQTARMKLEADCLDKFTTLNTSIAPLELERVLVRAKELDIDELPEAKNLRDRSNKLKQQLPIREGLRNLLQEAEATTEDLIDLLEEVKKVGLDEGGWLPELDESAKVAELKSRIDKGPPPAAETEAEMVESQSGKNKADKSDKPEEKKKKKKLKRRSTIAAISEEAAGKMLLELLAAMEVYDVSRLNDALGEAIKQGINDQQVMSDAQELFTNMEREDFLIEHISELCDVVASGAGNEDNNIQALKNLSGQAFRLGVAESARTRAKKIIGEKLRTRARNTLSNDMWQNMQNFDESMIDDAFADIMQFPGLRSPDMWKGHRGVGFLASVEKGAAIMMKHQSKPMLGALTKLPDQMEKNALMHYESIQGWMFDKAKTNVVRAHLITDLTQAAQKDVRMADEIYLQLIKQLTGNPSPRSLGAGWKLMLNLCQQAVPSSDLHEYLHVFLIQSILSIDLAEEKSLVQQCVSDLNRTANNEGQSEHFPVQVALIDASWRRVMCSPHLTILELTEAVKEQVHVRPDVDWCMFQNTQGLENHRLLPPDAIVKITLEKWLGFQEKTGKKSSFILKRRTLRVKETLDPAYPNDAKLTFLQALGDYKNYPIVESVRFVSEVGGRLLYLEREHYRNQIKNIQDGNLTGEGILEQLVPDRSLKESTRKLLSNEILKVLASHPAETKHVTMGRCYHLFQKMKLFGVQWWVGKQVFEVEPAKVTVDDKKFHEAYSGGKKDKTTLHKSQNCVINPKSKQHAYVMAVDLCGIRFMSAGDKSDNGLVFSRGFRFMEEHWERVLVWGARSNLLQLVVTTVSSSTPGAGRVPMRINFQTVAAVDICFVLHTLFSSRGTLD